MAAFPAWSSARIRRRTTTRAPFPPNGRVCTREASNRPSATLGLAHTHTTMKSHHPPYSALQHGLHGRESCRRQRRRLHNAKRYLCARFSAQQYWQSEMYVLNPLANVVGTLLIRPVAQMRADSRLCAKPHTLALPPSSANRPDWIRCREAAAAFKYVPTLFPPRVQNFQPARRSGPVFGCSKAHTRINPPSEVSGHASRKRLQQSYDSPEPTSTDGDFTPGSWTPGSK